jgi:hypothetical protein
VFLSNCLIIAANHWFEDLKGISVKPGILPKRCIPKFSERDSKGTYALRIFGQFARLLSEDKDCVPLISTFLLATVSVISTTPRHNSVYCQINACHAFKGIAPFRILEI